MTWFEADPALLDEELDALNVAGYTHEIDKAARADGRLEILVTYIIEDAKHILRCIYPSGYPFFAVKVIAPTFPPGRHLEPYHHTLCLFEDEQSVWSPSDTLAQVLNEQVPWILNAHKNPDIPAENEGRVGYQVTGQISYEGNSVIFVDDWSIPNSKAFGEMTIKLNINCKISTPIIGFVESAYCEDKVIIKNGFPFENIFTKKIPAHWVKLDAPPESITGRDALKEAIATYPKIKTPIYKNGIDIVGLVFQEESEYHKPIYNWIFVIRRQIKKGKNKKLNMPALSIIRSDRLTNNNIQKRIPKLRPLTNKSVTIVGAGALGSQIAWQLVRAGIKSITLIDCDVVQAGNIPRWLLGFVAIGRNKVDVLAQYFSQNYPDIRCTPINMRIGGCQKIPVDNILIDEHDFLCRIIQDSDIVIDAAAETNISLYLSHLCQDLKTPYIWATGTQGSWGGIVGRVIPDITDGTWTSFMHQYADGLIAAPPAEEGSDIQPVGCFHTTFTGTGFDMDHISLMATRIAVATLLRDEAGGYPDFEWDVGVLHLWDEDTGLPIAPKWVTSKLKRHTKQKVDAQKEAMDS